MSRRDLGLFGPPDHRPRPPVQNPELHWIAEMDLAIDLERARLGLTKRKDRA